MTWPLPPAADEPTTISDASRCSASSSRPAGTERASWTTNVEGMSDGSRVRAFSSASLAVCCRYSRYSASTRAGLGYQGAGTTAQTTRSSSAERASMPGQMQDGLAARVGGEAHEQAHGVPSGACSGRFSAEWCLP